MSKQVLGLIVGNRGFFPDHLCEAGRRTMIEVLESEGAEVVALTPADTKSGSVESLDDATKLAELFKRERDRISGVVVTLPNFGDERAIANVLRWANLGVPVLVQAFPDTPGEDDDRRPPRRVLREDVGLQQPDAVRHPVLADEQPHGRSDQRRVPPGPAELPGDVPGRRRAADARFGALGARPTAFNTVRYSEKLLERSGI